MNFSIERPWALCEILIMIPVLIYCVFNYKKTSAALFAVYQKNNSFNFKTIKKRIVLRILFRALAWSMMVFAFAGISWGTISSPVQKNGNAISLVFDISYSMTARDAPGGLSRLEASSSYAQTLLEHIEGAPVSVVLAKGGGVVAVPLTEDLQSVYALLNALSPSMLSSVGTNLGEGIFAALKSFPTSVSKVPVIWLFTDGEDTGNSLLNSLNTALRQGVSVVIIGFGSEHESEVVAGDGTTTVKTALRADKIKQAVESANNKNFGEQGFKFFKGAAAKYIDATQAGSAIAILSSIKKEQTEYSSDEKFSFSYEIYSVERHRLFILLAFVFFILSFFASEFNHCEAIASLNEFSQKSKKLASLLVLVCVFFVSCSGEFKESKKIFEATLNWQQGDYNEAVAKFSQSLSSAQKNGNDFIKQYALYGLSATYLMQNENIAALEKIDALSKTAPEKIRFAAFYNSGIIAQREGEYKKATEFFKKALLVDSTDINAKINLEVSQNQSVQQAKEDEENLSGAEERAETDSLLEKSVFNRIRENEQKQWKNLKNEQENTSALDY